MRVWVHVMVGCECVNVCASMRACLGKRCVFGVCVCTCTSTCVHAGAHVCMQQQIYQVAQQQHKEQHKGQQ